MVFRAYAKINLGLRVLDKRPDGFHNIETVFHKIDVWDEISFEPSRNIEVVSDDPDAPGDESNICFTAAAILRDYLGVHNGVRIRLKKRIPISAGLGGGSSDCARVLRELPGYWGSEVNEEDLRSLGLQLGSDVPYFLGEGSALARGRGDVLEYFPLEVPFAIVLCYPGILVSTAWAYRQVTPTPAGGRPDLRDIVLSGMRNPRLLKESLTNDFENSIFAAHASVRAVKESMLAQGARFALMSGSGSSVYGFFDDIGEAEVAAATFMGCGYRAFVTAPLFLPFSRGAQ
jgi:4-diphosphocytidyl-2-C-methyl-D-erythritol kinase